MTEFKIGDRVIMQDYLLEKPLFKNNIATIIGIYKGNLCLCFDNARTGLHTFSYTNGYEYEKRGFYARSEHVMLYSDYLVDLI